MLRITSSFTGFLMVSFYLDCTEQAMLMIAHYQVEEFLFLYLVGD